MKKLLIIFFICLFAGQGFAADWYTNCGDAGSNVGTFADPLKSFDWVGVASGALTMDNFKLLFGSSAIRQCPDIVGYELDYYGKSHLDSCGALGYQRRVKVSN